jgi:hypothetical protein
MRSRGQPSAAARRSTGERGGSTPESEARSRHPARGSLGRKAGPIGIARLGPLPLRGALHPCQPTRAPMASRTEPTLLRRFVLRRSPGERAAPHPSSSIVKWSKPSRSWLIEIRSNGLRKRRRRPLVAFSSVAPGAGPQTSGGGVRMRCPALARRHLDVPARRWQEDIWNGVRMRCPQTSGRALPGTGPQTSGPFSAPSENPLRSELPSQTPRATYSERLNTPNTSPSESAARSTPAPSTTTPRPIAPPPAPPFPRDRASLNLSKILLTCPGDDQRTSPVACEFGCPIREL